MIFLAFFFIEFVRKVLEIICIFSITMKTSKNNEKFYFLLLSRLLYIQFLVQKFKKREQSKKIGVHLSYFSFYKFIT
jgi:argonaute-like protein implicated in RNA metabolism and viral defense